MDSTRIKVNADPDSTSDGQDRLSMEGSILGFWGFSVAVCLMIAVTRLVRFLSKVRRARVDPRISTQRTLNQLLNDTSMNRSILRDRVRVEVIDSLIGPAVVGLVRPRILLPRVLESECTESDLRILLAHELTHIRRGDLWWALLQTVACCLWWFHPLVHAVSRWFDRETELSCDEETVAVLRCRPSDYARSLTNDLQTVQLHGDVRLEGNGSADHTGPQQTMEVTASSLIYELKSGTVTQK